MSHPALTILLSVPGLACWVIYYCMNSQLELPRTFYQLFWAIWMLAMYTAILSLIYLRWPTSRLGAYAICLNLVVNVPGLLLSIYMVLFGHIF